MKAAESLARVPGKPLPPRLAAAITIALATLATFMLLATSCSVARL
jgi:hypothetical protein